jgi:hypothetical protein
MYCIPSDLDTLISLAAMHGCSKYEYQPCV